ncbi:MAG: hypothetical protein WBF51_01825 [Candidatus Dormiibacterota bacterium]
MSTSDGGKEGPSTRLVEPRWDAELPKGQPTIWIPEPDRHSLEVLIGKEATDTVMRARHPFGYVGLLLTLIGPVLFLVTTLLHLKGALFTILGAAASTSTGLGIVGVVCFGLLASKGGRLASEFVSRRLGYPVKLGDVGPPTN